MIKNIFAFSAVLMAFNISFSKPVSHIMSQEELEQFAKENSQYNFKVEHAFKFMGKFEEYKPRYNPKKTYCGDYLDFYNPSAQFIDIVPTIRTIENEINEKKRFSRTQIVLDDVNDMAGYRFSHYPTSELESKPIISTLNIFRVIWLNRYFDSQEMKFTYNYNEVGWGGAVIKRTIQLEAEDKLTLIDDLKVCNLEKKALTFTEAATLLSQTSNFDRKTDVTIGMINFFNYLELIKYELTNEQSGDITTAKKILEKIIQ